MAEADRHGVFISWSKTVSAEVAKCLKPSLEDVLGSATIFMSQAIAWRPPSGATAEGRPKPGASYRTRFT